MIKGFPIEFVRVALEQTLLKNKIDNPNRVGGKEQIEIHSFYEQLKTQDEVDRFVDTFRDLTEQQNRMGLIANGILMSPENPTITNLYSTLIIPMTWACSLRVKLSDRDLMLETINDLVDELKGSKVDIAELQCRDEQGRVIYVPFMVGTIGHNLNAPSINNGDYIGEVWSLDDLPTSNDIALQVKSFTDMGIANLIANGDYVYLGNQGKIRVAQYGFNQIFGTDDWEIDDINYDALQDDITTVSGYVTFKSEYGGYTDYPEITEAKLQMYITDQVGHIEEHIVNLDIPDGGMGIDADGYINFRTYFEFETQTSEWDWANVDVVIDGLVDEPKTLGYEIITSGDNIIFPPTHESFEKYKLSMSFEGLRCDTPRTLNGDEYCEISFGGSATLVNSGVKLGNDLVKLSFQKNKLLAQTPITYSSSTTYYVEPLELPSGNSANTIPNQIIDNHFKVNSHTDSLTLTLQYTFICDLDQDFLKQLYKYGRYGTQGITASDISPNMIYNVVEWWSSWGEVDKETYLGKLIESVDIENTESDTMTLTITMQIQGENN